MGEPATKADLYYALTVAAKARRDAFNESREIAEHAFRKYDTTATQLSAVSKIHNALMLAKAASCEAEAMLELYNETLKTRPTQSKGTDT